MTVRFTRADYALLPEGFPAELVRGQLVREATPTYGHQLTVVDLFSRLSTLVPRGKVLVSPIEVGIDEFNVFQPDIVVLRTVPGLDVRDVGIPLLAIEVLSPSTARRDRGVKRRRLLAAGVREVWIVDPDAKTVERHDADGCATVSGSEKLASRAVTGFEVVPAVLFEPPKP